MRRSTIVRLFAGSRALLATMALLAFAGRPGHATEPDPKSYWDVDDIRPGMKGVGQTVMVRTKLEEFGAEVLGVMRGVSPGRDMILCRLTGCNLEHAGIIQGMSGSPIYIDGKLVGETPLTRVPLKPGPYKVKAVGPRNRTKNFNINIYATKDTDEGTIAWDKER